MASEHLLLVHGADGRLLVLEGMNREWGGVQAGCLAEAEPEVSGSEWYYAAEEADYDKGRGKDRVCEAMGVVRMWSQALVPRATSSNSDEGT